jgi:hypothetical protein
MPDTATEHLGLDTVKAAIERAHREVGAIAAEGAHRRWRMSIPAQPDRDSDLVISRALDYAEALHAEVTQLRRYLTDMVLAAENVEAEADAENRSSQSLAAMRRVMNTIPADALTLDKPGEETP